MKKHLLLIGMFGICAISNGQILKKLKDKITTKTEQKVDAKVDNKIDSTLDTAIDGNIQIPKKEKKKKQINGEEKGDVAYSNRPSDTMISENENRTSYQSKFDFVPGDKIVLWEDFTEDAVGDFPAKWNTSGSGEVVILDGLERKWLMMQANSNFALSDLLSLPENCTIQFDIMLTLPFDRITHPLNFCMGDIKNPGNYLNTSHYSLNDNKNITFWLTMHPGEDKSDSAGYGNYLMNNTSTSNLVNEKVSLPGFLDLKEKLPLKVSIWKQKQRIRVYMNENKVLDLPKILPTEMNINTLVWSTAFYQGDNKYFISNLRVASGDPDTRNKLITEGKLVSNGILFNVNSSIIKPESYGVLKGIANVLKENNQVRVMIVGHTDSDGADDANQELSLKRAIAIKHALSSDFKINDSRMETDGKGESEPLLPNSNSVNKANNRRVEFVKID